uniref:Peptidase S1 domain-containing protein n=1 Tax=Arion vulgaris TaxID=1028688 RepID=A0A0B6Z1W8_9EUPU
MPKVISVGKHVHFEATLSLSHAHYHTGSTCPGSSGSPVYYLCPKEKGNHHMWLPAVHSFHCLISKRNCAFR